MGITVGIDTGGTFTDLVAVDDESGRWHVAKVPSNPDNPVAAIDASLGAAGFDPADVDFVVVGTTIGINAVLTRRGARVVYLTTEGFQDVPHIQRINRKHHYDFHWRKPTPLVHRPDCLGVAERMDEEGRVLEPIDLEALGDGARGGRRQAARSCPRSRSASSSRTSTPSTSWPRASCSRSASRSWPVSLSHEVAPIWREYERGTTVTVDAYLKPLFERYVDGVSTALEGKGTGGTWALLKSNGGHALAGEARARPAHLLLSGIAGGAIGGAYAARAAGAPEAIALDMGGTSCDVCLIVGGEPLYSSDFEIEFGLPVSVPSVSTRTIGAGGGSIGWVDPGGFLQVGPQSAGAVPGPACYGQGGESATITDADVVLGRLDPAFFLGGKLPLDAELARGVLDALGGRARPGPRRDGLGHGAHLQREHGERDPHRDGRAGHRPARVRARSPSAAPARRTPARSPTRSACAASIVPPRPGLCSAFGALAAIVRVDAVRSVYLTDRTTSAGELDALFGELEAQAQADVDRAGARRSSPPCAARSRCATRARTTSRRSRCPDGDGRRRRARRGATPSTAASTRASTATASTASRSSSCGSRSSRWASRPCSRACRARTPRARARARRDVFFPELRLRPDRHRAPRAPRRRARRAPARSSSSPWTRPSSSRPAGRSRWPRAASSTSHAHDRSRHPRRHQQQPREHLPRDGHHDDPHGLLADLQRGPRLLVRAVRPARQHDRPGGVLPGADRGQPVHRALDARGARHRVVRARRRRAAQRPLPRRRAHPRALRDPARLPRGRAVRLRRQRRPPRRDRRQGRRQLRRRRHRGLPGGPADPARQDRQARRQRHGPVAADHGQPPHAAEHVGRPERADRLPAGRRAARASSCSTASAATSSSRPPTS